MTGQPFCLSKKISLEIRQGGRFTGKAFPFVILINRMHDHRSQISLCSENEWRTYVAGLSFFLY